MRSGRTAADREGKIDTATAEAFAAVPDDRQLEVWKEVGGSPRPADHVRNVIANAWIDAKHALFDVSTLPAVGSAETCSAIDCSSRAGESAKLAPSKLDALIDLLIVDRITAHMQRGTELVHHLATELKVNVRDSWRTDASCFADFQKIQLAHLIAEL